MTDTSVILQQIRERVQTLRRQFEDNPKMELFDPFLEEFKDGIHTILQPYFSRELTITGQNLESLLLSVTLAMELINNELLGRIAVFKYFEDDELPNLPTINRINMTPSNKRLKEMKDDDGAAESVSTSLSSMKLLSEAVKYLPSTKTPPPS